MDDVKVVFQRLDDSPQQVNSERGFKLGQRIGKLAPVQEQAVMDFMAAHNDVMYGTDQTKISEVLDQMEALIAEYEGTP
jgi:hypothetical protein